MFSPCEYCGKSLSNHSTVMFKGKFYHVLVDEHGTRVPHEWCCWAKSEQGTKVWDRKEVYDS